MKLILSSIAVNDRGASEAIRSEAKAKGKLVNVADKPDLCDFYLGLDCKTRKPQNSHFKTNGKSPTIAKRLQEVFSRCLARASRRLA